ncbi:MAG TPA: gamma-glutamyltransferase [Mesotoga sp.]|nr:gamma-glutamyltransferase [Mesotoga sp.]MDI9375414.1 gamma-glutamyltransferase [Thermotogota bacterium]MDD4477765.1 gamma-glutamyltransferase [Mesotoga sp.]MDD5743870.1 gamma-glutamyltransferase [Mesotoga sp.]HOI63848.1 gamma-glutamyltransferase [Mesotoga sp.]
MRKAILVSLMALMIVSMFAVNPLNLYGRDAEGRNGVVAAAKPEASEVGVKILEMGGNAVDAAIATAFALGVLEPNASGLGGGGFMIIQLAHMDEAVVIDFRETAPSAAGPTFFNLDERNRVINNETIIGGKSSGVPGEVAGLLYALENFGTMSRAQVIQPAIEWAEKGIPVTVNLFSIINDNYEKIMMMENGAELYLKDGGIPYEIGETIVLKDLADTLRIIVEKGKDGFYKGEIAEKIVAEVQKRGGVITLEDLANYDLQIRKPVVGTYRDYTILSVPPASSGGTHIIELLNIMENFDLATLGDNTPETLHLWSEAMKLIFADRSKYMADTAFVDVPLTGLTSKEYARTLAAKIDPNKPMESVAAGDPWQYESGSTTHLSVMDKEGNMVAITKSINYFFGSGVVVPGTGIIMNNHMDDFVPTPGSANSVEPGKRPLSSMSPTLVLDPQGRPYMTLGSPGATRIITTVAQVISNIIDHGMTIQQAILAPRVFRMASGSMSIEGRISINAYNKLLEMGHQLTLRGDYDAYFGGVHGVLYNYDIGILFGGADPRRDGQAFAF